MIQSIYNLTVRGYELDSFGHVNNAVYLQYAESAKWDFFYKSGCIEQMKKLDLFPVVLENNIRYMHELRLMDEVEIETEFTCSVGIIRFRHIIKNTATNQTVCRITGKLAYVDKERIICDIPEEIRELIGE
ncbi:MAG: acyl-CoA thioesterase [Ruminococcus sp.]|nr:acyl-CoA thioesterase [Ruminococcus sp.]